MALRTVILDPTGLYPIPEKAVPIQTEREWLERFFRSDGQYWVQGKFLCTWAKAWLQAWGLTDCIVEEKKHPRTMLAEIFDPFPIPEFSSESECIQESLHLAEFGVTGATDAGGLGRLLSARTGYGEWMEKPSLAHLAWWLGYKSESQHSVLEKLWLYRFCETCPEELGLPYGITDKQSVLRQWIGITDEKLIIGLGPFPLNDIPSSVATEFINFWEHRLVETQGATLDELVSDRQAGMKCISEIAFRIFKINPKWITPSRLKKVAPYLPPTQREWLNQNQPPPCPEKLSLQAHFKEMYAWVTEKYLPFRRWEAVNDLPKKELKSESLAYSFVDWILENYPQLKEETADESQLNLSVVSLVQKLSREAPVLWVVVDGLGWLDHVELLECLHRESELKVEGMSARIAVLPTKTEYAKWSLYSQLLPKDQSWKPDAGNGFRTIQNANRYTDGLRSELPPDLKTEKYRIFCWDSEMLDKLYHEERDPRKLYKVLRPHTLNGIALLTAELLNDHPQKEQMWVVISSDHGQLLGEAQPIEDIPSNLECKGRMAIGTTTDDRFVNLAAAKFGLPYDISVVRGSGCLHNYKTTVDGTVLGSHGGLFPEEVIVGVSVLRINPDRLPVVVKLDGNGKAGKPGHLILSVTNPNSIALQELVLSIEGGLVLVDFPIEATIPPNQTQMLQIFIQSWPELSPTQKEPTLSLTGHLKYRFLGSEYVTSYLSKDSVIRIEQIFASGGMDLEEFL